MPLWPIMRCWLAALLAGAALANVEKTVFVAPSLPPSSSLLSAPPASTTPQLASLPRLAPDGDARAWRTFLPAAFPWDADFGARATTWMRLDHLQPGRRYEVRVCWAATQPTAFALDTFDAAAVQTTPELAASLARFVAHQVAAADLDKTPTDMSSSSPPPLLLRIVAAADYVAANRSLMHAHRVPPVAVDVILDPFVANVVPRSLLPTVGCLAGVALAAAWLAQHVVRWLCHVAGPAPHLRLKKRL